MGKIILDLDDTSYDQKRNALNWLFEFKSMRPDFKVTLFAIYHYCPKGFLDEIRKIDWIQLVPHGFKHDQNDEVYFWDRKYWNYVLDCYEERGCFQKGFKAPNWQMTTLGYDILKERGYWVAVRKMHLKELPKGIKYYCFEDDKDRRIHGHTWLMANHKLEGKFNWEENDTFEFVSQNIDDR